MSPATVRRFGDGDLGAMLTFAQALPEHDLLFLGRDLRHPRVVRAWAAAISEGIIDSLIAEQTSTIVATAALVRDRHGWSRHVGEVRVLVAPAARGQGIGRLLLDECLRIAAGHGLAQLVAHMTPDQTGAIELFESAGFRGEALLRDHVMGRDRMVHDIAILSLDLAHEAARKSAFGLD